MKMVFANSHFGQGKRGHLQIVGDAEPAKPSQISESAAQLIGVPSCTNGREQRVEVIANVFPRFSVPGNFELSTRAVDFELSADEHIRRANRPDDLAGFSWLSRESVVCRDDGLH